MTTRRYKQRRRAVTAEETRRRILDAGLLRVPHTTAVDTRWLLTAFETFDTLYTGRHLPAETVADHLDTLATAALLQPSPAT